MCRSTSVASDDDGIVDELHAGSSPTSTTAPPFGLAPANTPWRRASPARSSPGALPYQTPTTPSYRASGRPGASCEPITAVAPSSSFTAGWWTIGQVRHEGAAPAPPPGRSPPSGEPG